MNIIPIQNVWFDDAATSAMGEAFDRACGLLRSSGSAVPEIIANLIIQAAKDGQHDAAHLCERVFMSFGADAGLLAEAETLSLRPTLRSRTQRHHKPGFLPGAGLSSCMALAQVATSLASS